MPCPTFCQSELEISLWKQTIPRFDLELAPRTPHVQTIMDRHLGIIKAPVDQDLDVFWSIKVTVVQQYREDQYTSARLSLKT